MSHLAKRRETVHTFWPGNDFTCAHIWNPSDQGHSLAPLKWWCTGHVGSPRACAREPIGGRAMGAPSQIAEAMTWVEGGHVHSLATTSFHIGYPFAPSVLSSQGVFVRNNHSAPLRMARSRMRAKHPRAWWRYVLGDLVIIYRTFGLRILAPDG